MKKQVTAAKPMRRKSKKKKSTLGNHVAQVVTVLATTMGGAYVILRIFNWFHFF